jgi:hypothetical protein
MKYNRVKFSASLAGMPKRTTGKKALLFVRRAPGKLCLPDIAKKEAGYFFF